MIPVPGKALTDLAIRIATHLVPNTQSTFAQADGQLITALLLSMAQDFERAVYNRMADIDEIKGICRTLSTLDKSDLTQLSVLSEAVAFQAKTPASLMLADVTALHAEGFELLIAIHAWAEQYHAELDLQIWRLLRRHSERNKFEIPGP